MSFKFKSGRKISLWIPISFTAVVGTLISFSLFLYLYNVSKEDIKQKFHRASRERANLIVEHLNDYLRELEAVQRFFDGSNFVTREEFKKFVAPIVVDKGFQAIEWLPRVSKDRKKEFENMVKKEGYKDFCFTEIDSISKIIPVKDRSEYFPVFYVEPFEGNEAAFGYSPPETHPARGRNLKIACDENRPIASERVTLIQEKNRCFAFLVVLPVYKGTLNTPSTVALRRKMLDGYIQGVFRPVDIVESALEKFSQTDIAIRLLDMSADRGKKILHFFYNGKPNESIIFDTSLVFSQMYEFCGRTFKIECYPEDTFVKQNIEKSYLTMPVITGLFTLFVVMYLATLVFQRRKMEVLVEIRTKELKESEERFRSLIQNSNDIFLIVDHKEIIRLISPAVESIIGYSPAEMINNSIYDLMFHHDIAIVKSAISEIIGNPLQMFTTQFRYHKKQGGVCYLEAVSQNLIDTPGVKGIVINIRDITERKQFENELIEAKHKAEEMNRVKSSFFANMSHELRTPLHGILGISQILEESAPDGKNKRLVEMLSQSGKRLLNTLNMILNLSRIEANKLDIVLSELNANDLIKDSLKLFEPAAKEKQLTLTYINKCEGLILNTDEQMLLSVFNNMIDNAIKYTNAGGIKVISSIEKQENNNFFVLKVEDTGIGISEENQEIIFDEFRQVSEGYNRSFEGTGLGLSIMKKYVELLNGKITVSSKLNEGSTFSVYLPLPKDNEIKILGEFGNKPALIQVEKNTDGIQDKILLVDDEDITYNLLCFWLKKTIPVDYAANSTEAIEMIKSFNYPLVILDINLKRGGNGISVLKELREIPGYKDTPVIACTAYAMYGDKEKLLNEGFSYYLSKPFEKSELVPVVRRFLNHKENEE